MRSSPLIEYSSTVLILSLWLGAITTVFSSLIGLFQQDIKKVIAYSTMSQLARIYNKIILIIYRHQTVCEKFMKILYYTLMMLILIVNYFLIFLLLKEVITLANDNIDIFIAYCGSTPLICTTSKAKGKSWNKKLNPYYITGFMDDEGCFLIKKSASNKLSYSVNLSFKISLHLIDKRLLNIIIYFDKVGYVITRKNGFVEFLVNSLKYIEVIKHFESYPLITQKWSDYQLLKQTFLLIKGKEHLTIEGFKKVLSLKAVLNKGLAFSLKTAFPNIMPYIRPQNSIKGAVPLIQDPYWVSGFVEGEGCFYVILTKDLTRVNSLQFQVTQHTRDAHILKEFITYFNSGRYSIYGNKYANFVVTKLSDINMQIIPFFKKYPILGDKSRNFIYFEKIAKLMANKVHLTTEGLQEIKQIKSSLNKKINKIASTNPLQKCSQKRRYVTMSALHFCNNNHQSIKLNFLINERGSCYSKWQFGNGIRFYSSNEPNQKDGSFYEWLAGLIDGNGKFFVSKKGYANFQITMTEKDKYALYTIKYKYGGSVKSMASNKLKYKLHHKKGLIGLVNDVNGLIRNPSRMLELNKVCVLYNIEFKAPKSLTFYNGWFSGLVDSEGFIHIDEKTGQLIITVTHKNNYLLESLQTLYGGRIRIISSKDAFIYSIYRKKEILDLLGDYFKKYPLRSSKSHKLNLIPKFYLVYTIPSSLEIEKFKQWIDFKNKWDKL